MGVGRAGRAFVKKRKQRAEKKQRVVTTLLALFTSPKLPMGGLTDSLKFLSLAAGCVLALKAADRVAVSIDHG